MTRFLDEINYWTLPVPDRLVLAQDILDSVLAEAQAAPLHPDQLAELDRRCAAVDSGVMRAHAWEDVRSQLLNEHGRE